MKKLIIILSFIILSSMLAFVYAKTNIESADFLAAKGIIKEQKDKSFYKLDSTITRGEMMKIIGKLSGKKIEDKCTGIFSDVNKSGWACKYIEFAYREKMIAKNSTFRPNDLITKTESIKLLLKVMGVEKVQKTENWQEDYMVTAFKKGFITKKYSDYNTSALRGWIFSIATTIIEKNDGINLNLISGEVKIIDKKVNEDNEIYIEAEDGKLIDAGKYSQLGKSSRGEEAYIGDGGAKVNYTINSNISGYYKFFIRLTDDGKHVNGTRNATILVNNVTINYNHISENTKGRKWFLLPGVTLNKGKNTVSFKKDNTTSAAFIMDAFKLVPSKIDSGIEINSEYNAINEQNDDLIDRCKQYKLATYKGINNLETYTCDSITNNLNLDFHWYDFNPNANGTLFLTVRNNDKSGDIELYVKNYGTLKGENGSPIFFKVPSVKNGETISYRISGTKGVNYYIKVDFNNGTVQDNGDGEDKPEVGSDEFLKEHPNCTEDTRNSIKSAREFNANIDLSEASQYTESTSYGVEPCWGDFVVCNKKVKDNYLNAGGKYVPCAIGTSCYSRFKTELIQCATTRLNCIEKEYCGFITK